jgi:hypothetical protein
MLAPRVEQKNGSDRTERPRADAQRDDNDLFQAASLDHSTISSPTLKRQSGGALPTITIAWNQ